MKATAVYYNTKSPEKANLVKEVLMRLDIRIREVASGQVGETVGYLAGAEGFELQGTQGWEQFLPIIKDEVLILHNFTQEQLDALLYELRRVNASVALKAVVTQSNCSWPFWKLYEELQEEHAQMMQSMNMNKKNQ